MRLLLALAGGILFGGAVPVAWGLGFNASSLVPALDDRTALLWETTAIAPRQKVLWAFGLGYALRPVEVAVGGAHRVVVSDHGLMSHIGFAYGARDDLDLGLTLPVALYSNPQNVPGTVNSLGSRSRNFVFAGDVTVRGKYLVHKDESGVWELAVIPAVQAPTGEASALLSDGAFRWSLEWPTTIFEGNKNREFFVTPGVAWWTERVGLSHTPQGDNPTVRVLDKRSAILFQAGVRRWYRGISKLASEDPRDVLLEIGLRSEWSRGENANQFEWGGAANPSEWNAGIAVHSGQEIPSVHAAVGGRLGQGIGVPLFRVTLGIRTATD